MTELATTGKDKLMNDLRLVIADAEDLLRLSVDQVGERATEVRERVQDRIDQAKGDLLQLQESALTKAKEAGHVADDYVRDHPWTAVGIASGVGLLLGLLLSRR